MSDKDAVPEACLTHIGVGSGQLRKQLPYHSSMIRDNDAVPQACLTHNGGWTRIVEGDSEMLINQLACLFFDDKERCIVRSLFDPQRGCERTVEWNNENKRLTNTS